MRAARKLGAAAVVGTALLAAAPNASAQAIDFTRCRDGGRCASVPVPLDHSNPAAGTIRLQARIVEGGRRRSRNAVLFLPGGPGAASLPAVNEPLPSFVRVRPLNRYRALLFDARGTGRSGRLSCPVLERALSARDSTTQQVVDAVGACAVQLGERRRYFDTAQMVGDIEEMRQAFGIAKLGIIGVSYGTLPALRYAAAYPANVDFLVLDSPVPYEGVDPLGASSLAAIPRVLDEICSNRACDGVTRDAKADLRRVFERLGSDGVRTPVIEPSGRRTDELLTRSDVIGLLFASDANDSVTSRLPGALRAGAGGDLAPLLRIAHDTPSELDLPAAAFSPTLYATNTCGDLDAPWSVSDPLERRNEALASAISNQPEGAFGPVPRQLVADFAPASICPAWPEAGDRAAPPPIPRVRTLILGGRRDLRTPESEAARLAAQIPGSQRRAVIGAGHSVLSIPDCAGHIRRFLTGRGDAAGCDAFQPIALPVPPLSLDRIKPVRPYSGRRGRTLRAVALSLEEVLVRTFDFVELFGFEENAETIRAPGLRGGRALLRPNRYRLSGYEHVPGILLSGSLDASLNRGRIRVTGSAAARGVLRIGRGLRVSGRLGGRRVRTTLPTRYLDRFVDRIFGALAETVFRTERRR